VQGTGRARPENFADRRREERDERIDVAPVPGLALPGKNRAGHESTL
jgi:hypothetical protein